MPAAWLLVEWWRSWFLTGFGWLALGYAHTDNWLGALAPAVGQYGLGYLTLLMAGALVTVALGTARERVSAGALFAAIWIVAFLFRGIEWTQPYGRPVEVAVVQGAVPQDEKWIAEQPRVHRRTVSKSHPRGARRRHHLLAGIGRARPG